MIPKLPSEVELPECGDSYGWFSSHCKCHMFAFCTLMGLKLGIAENLMWLALFHAPLQGVY